MLISIAGLVFFNEAGIFVGLTLLPWQVIKLQKSDTINIIALVLSTAVGSIFLVLMKEWFLLILFLFIQLYNYWGHVNLFKTKEDEDNEGNG
ncbi:MAG: hypothetical protein ACOCQW_05580 [Halanaerobiaceae bacterium]